jgi:hypothetical protein
MDDVTWGTKGINAEGVGSYYYDKLSFVGVWLFKNFLLISFLVLGECFYPD